MGCYVDSVVSGLSIVVSTPDNCSGVVALKVLLRLRGQATPHVEDTGQNSEMVTVPAFMCLETNQNCDFHYYDAPNFGVRTDTHNTIN